MRAYPTTRAGRLFYQGSTIAALAVGALQMARVRGGLVTSYGADLFGTAWLYALVRQGRTLPQRGRNMGAARAGLLVFAGCAASEFAQRLGWIPGTYDPADLAVFAATLLACVLVDRRVTALA